MTVPAPPQASSTAALQPDPRPDIHKVGPFRLRRFSLTGVVLGVLLACLSVTPSLVPRAPVVEGLLAGLCLAIGYGLGAFLGWAYRALALPDLPPGVRHKIWAGLGILIPVALVVGGWLGWRWQSQQRELLGMDDGASWTWIVAPLIGIVVAALFLAIGRGFIWIGRKLASWLHRILPVRVAGLIAVVVTVVLGWSVLSGLLVNGVLGGLDAVFTSHANDNKPGVVNTNSPYGSGGPTSGVTWDSLGREGRQFVWQRQTAQQIAQVTGDTKAVEPIRAFIGLPLSSDATTRANLAVEELKRLGGFDRRLIAVAGTTGSGWVDPKAAAAIEYVAHGDVTTVTTQYSYLPSWLSFLVDRSRAQDNAQELITAIRVALDSIPADQRPELYVYGESLGAFSTGSAFTSVEDLWTTTDGALLIGVPSFERTWQRMQVRREAGSPLWRPVYADGAFVRTAATTADLTPPGMQWTTPNRIIFLVNPSDPIVAWTANHSEWLNPRGPDVPKNVVALPLVGGLQATLDQFNSTGVPAGHGHVYDQIVVPAWAQILAPPQLPAAEVEAITKQVAQISDPN